MSTRTTVETIDDLDNSPGATTVHYAFEGQHYEIDLSDAHRDELLGALQRYIVNSRRVGIGMRKIDRGTTRAQRNGARPPDVDLVQLRGWAKTNDVALPSRGRIPRAIVEQYVAWRDKTRAA